MEQFLTGWRDDIPASWRETFEGVAPDLGAIGPSLTLAESENIFPGRRGRPAPGAREDTHIFRALDSLQPDNVTAVVLGQDPYPRPSRATGRSFEQGDLPRWRPKNSEVAESLRRIVQVVAHFRTGRSQYLEGDAAWAALVHDIEADHVDIAQPREFFDAWQKEGILCLNAALTLSRFSPEIQQAHFSLWRPIVQAIFRRLVLRPNRSIAFLLWGGVAFETFSSLKVLQVAEEAGTRKNVTIVRHPHPGAEDGSGAPRFLELPNIFAVANQRIIAAGGVALPW